MDNILTFTKEHARKAGKYQDNSNCLLATVLKEKFPDQEVVAFGWTFQVGKMRYRLKGDISMIVDSYTPSRGKVDLRRFKPFELTF